MPSHLYDIDAADIHGIGRQARNVWATDVTAAIVSLELGHVHTVEAWHADSCWCWSEPSPTCPHDRDWYACPACEPYVSHDACPEHRAGCPAGAH